MESTNLSMLLTILLFFGYGLGLNLSNGQESDAEERNLGEIITEIRSLLNQTIIEYQNKNSSGASALVEEAYLENYEFIEASLAEHNETLMEETEVMLREQLRDLVKSDGVEADVQSLLQKINSNLDQADKLLTNQTETN
jgi:predicted ribosome quality control (RQC) complex YloA/Tae2 family protein